MLLGDKHNFFKAPKTVIFKMRKLVYNYISTPMKLSNLNVVFIDYARVDYTKLKAIYELNLAK